MKIVQENILCFLPLLSFNTVGNDFNNVAIKVFYDRPSAPRAVGWNLADLNVFSAKLTDNQVNVFY